jgi:hypothetical protein
VHQSFSFEHNLPSFLHHQRLSLPQNGQGSIHLRITLDSSFLGTEGDVPATSKASRTSTSIRTQHQKRLGSTHHVACTYAPSSSTLLRFLGVDQVIQPLVLQPLVLQDCTFTTTPSKPTSQPSVPTKLLIHSNHAHHPIQPSTCWSRPQIGLGSRGWHLKALQLQTASDHYGTRPALGRTFPKVSQNSHYCTSPVQQGAA